MATIYKEFLVSATSQFAWEAIKDVGSVHTRLAQDFVSNTALDGDIRMAIFACGFAVKERIITSNDQERRLAYPAVEGRASHHNAYLQIIPALTGQSRLLCV